MISDRLLALVRCPECRRARSRGDAERCSLPAAAGAATAQPARDYLDLRPLRSVRGTDEVPGRGAARRRAARAGLAAAARLADPQRHAARVPRARPGRPGRRSRLRQRPGAAVEPRTRRATAVGIDISPFFSRGGARGGRSAARRSAPAAVRRRHVHKACSLDVLEHLSPEALRGMLAEAARVLAPGGALFVYTHVRKNAPIAVGLRWINAPGPAARATGPDRHAPGAAAQVRSPQPAARRAGARAGRRATPGSASRRIRYYTPIVGGFVENIVMRVAERALARRRGAATAAPVRRRRTRTREAVREARTAAKAAASRRAGRPTPSLRGAVGRHEARPPAVRPDPLGPVLRAAGRRNEPPGCHANPLLRHRPDGARHGRRVGARTAVAEGLAALGHDVHVLVSPGDGPLPGRAGALDAMPPPLGRTELRWARTRRGEPARASSSRPTRSSSATTTSAARRSSRARRLGATTMLEVNAPVIDYPARRRRCSTARCSSSRCGDGASALCRRPTSSSRRAQRSCRPARRAAKILELEWGADTGRFHPDAAGRCPSRRPAGHVAVFAGAFRRWHGAINLVRAIRSAARARRHGHLGAVLVGDGPELRRRAVSAARRAWTTWSSPARCPTQPCRPALAAADIGVAPFDLGAHAPLALGFYWSPLKIFEYMAAGLPVVAPAAAPHPGARRRTSAKGCCTTGRGPRRSPTRSRGWPTPALRAAPRRRSARTRRARVQLGAPTAARWTPRCARGPAVSIG